MHTIPIMDQAHAAPMIEETSFADHVPAQQRVLVFRTSVATAATIERLRSSLDHLTGFSGRWSFDLEDRDHVLRMETAVSTTKEVIGALRAFGEQCSEME